MAFLIFLSNLGLQEGKQSSRIERGREDCWLTSQPNPRGHCSIPQHSVMQENGRPEPRRGRVPSGTQAVHSPYITCRSQRSSLTAEPNSPGEPRSQNWAQPGELSVASWKSLAASKLARPREGGHHPDRAQLAIALAQLGQELATIIRLCPRAR